jgi:hypothetical protein
MYDAANPNEHHYEAFDAPLILFVHYSAAPGKKRKLIDTPLGLHIHVLYVHTCMYDSGSHLP